MRTITITEDELEQLAEAPDLEETIERDGALIRFIAVPELFVLQSLMENDGEVPDPYTQDEMDEYACTCLRAADVEHLQGGETSRFTEQGVEIALSDE